MSEHRRRSDRTSSDRPRVTHDQAGHVAAAVTRSHGNVEFGGVPAMTCFGARVLMFAKSHNRAGYIELGLKAVN